MVETLVGVYINSLLTLYVAEMVSGKTLILSGDWGSVKVLMASASIPCVSIIKNYFNSRYKDYGITDYGKRK